MANSSAPVPVPGPATDATSDPWYGWNPYENRAERRDDPFPMLNGIREKHPVHKTPEGYWRLFRHDDVTRLLREVKVGVRTTEGVLLEVDESDFPRRFMLHQDPPNHTRLRRLMSRAFTPPAIERMRVHVQQLVDGLLDAVADKGELDVIADLARPLPSTVICEMMGVPLEDREPFTEWTALTTHLLAPQFLSPNGKKRAFEAGLNLASYFVNLIEQRKKNLGDDMLSVLIQGEQDDRLSQEELIVHATGLLVAGFETTIGVIGNGVRALLLHPEQLRKLKERPALIERAVEECLRYEGPIIGTRRCLHEDAEFQGVRIPKNTQVMVSIAAAHRDPRVFTNPDGFDIERETHANLAFGGGAHFCLGAHLARLEAQIAIGTLVRRFDDFELMTDKAEWGQSLFRILGKLPVKFRA